MFEPKLGVSLHTISRDVTQEQLEAVGRSRIKTLELAPKLHSGDGQEEAKSLLKGTLARNGIRVATIHAPFGGEYDFSSLDERAHERAVAEIEASLDLAAEFDAPMIVVHASAEPIDPAERPRRLKQARRGLAEMGKRCSATGRQVVVELLPRTCLGNTIEELLDILDGFDEKTFGVCLDTNHLMDRYRTLADEVRRLDDRLLTLHLSDYDGVDEKHELPGRGVVDWKAFMGALRDIDYRGPFNYEAKLDGETPAERVQSLEKNFDWLHSL